MGDEWEQSEEDRIIAMLQDTRATNYCDSGFSADPTSLHRDPEFVPEYDKVPQAIRWMRGVDYASNPDYLKDDSSGVVINGRMDDIWLVTAMAAVAAHPTDPNNPDDGTLIETLFGSSPDDFKDFGVYTARIYKNGQWVEVVCDTRVPCAPPSSRLVVVPGLKTVASLVPVCSRAENANEMWVPFIEKAFAKYHGSYESLNGGCIGEALVDLTGGSVEIIDLNSSASKTLADGPGGKLWTLLASSVEDKYTIVCASVPTKEEDKREIERIAPPEPSIASTPKSPSVFKNKGFSRQMSSGNMNVANSSSNSISSNGGVNGLSLGDAEKAAAQAAVLIPGTSGIDSGACISVLQAKKGIILSDGSGVDLVQLKNHLPGGGFSWSGDWGRRSNKWSENTEVAEELSPLGGVPETRLSEEVSVGSSADDGTFWISASDFLAVFSKLYICRVFPDSRFKQYCIHGEWTKETSGGGLRCHPDDCEHSAKIEILDFDQHHKSVSLLDLHLCEAYAQKANPQVLVRPSIQPSINNSWFKNPQYSIMVSPSEVPNIKVHISLSQQDRRSKMKLGENIPLGFTVLKRKSGLQSRCWNVLKSHEVVFDSSKSPIVNAGSGWVASSANSLSSNQKEIETLPMYATREVCGDLVLDTGANYLIIPHTEKQGQEAKYILRLFTSNNNDLNVSTIPKVHTIVSEGAWTRGDIDCCGGPLLTVQEKLKPSQETKEEESVHDLHLAANPKWCENPQYLLRMPSGVPQSSQAQVTLVLKRTDLLPKVIRGMIGRRGQPNQPDHIKYDDRAPGIGLVVTKVCASEDPADRRRRNKQEMNERTDALGEALPSKESSLKHKPRTVYLAEAREAAAMSETGKELPVERKMAISSHEWHKMSDMSNRVVTSVSIPLFSSSFAPDGLIIVPTLSVVGTPATYSLEVFSDTPGLRLDAMPAGRSKTIAGEWLPATAGGSHINTGTWKRNPRFHLKILGGRTKLKITLTRPATAWKSQTTKDSLGCMIGFYVCRGPITNRDLSGAILYEDEAWSETPFVPTNSVSTPVDFELDPLEDEVYSIIPATFDPGHVGPFVLSVTSDSEVRLTKDVGGRADGSKQPAGAGKAGGLGGFSRFVRK